MIDAIQRCFQSLDADAIQRGELGELYAEDAVFIDPFHRIEGKTALEAYFGRLYRNVRSISFDYGDSVQSGNDLMMTWTMTVSHPRLKGGRSVTVNGMTHFRLRDDTIILHHDYFDAGAMLYENLPVIGGIIQWIKGKMGQ